MKNLPGGIAAALIATIASSYAAPETLKEAYGERFMMGAALNHQIILATDHPARALVSEHFDSITPANALKWGPFNPKPGEYNFGPADAFVAFGEANKQYIVGHTLFWHQQTPKWVFEDDSGAPITREALLARMRERVKLLADRYGSRIQAWDVVNETFENDGSLRDSAWTRVLGADFVTEAFRIAQEELPADVKLIYNDFSMNEPGKRGAVVKMIHELRAKGIRIDAVGMQGHYHLKVPSIDDIEASIVAFAGAGVRVHVTELDVEVLPRTGAMSGADLNERRRLLTAENNPYTEGLPDQVQKQLAERYADLFRVFVKHADKIDRVTFWGVTDADSWLNFWPVPGRTNHPLLFDRNNQPKPAFDAVMAVGAGN